MIDFYKLNTKNHQDNFFILKEFVYIKEYFI